MLITVAGEVVSVNTSELIYPVVAICKNGILEASDDEDILTTATGRELKIGWFDNLTIIDSEGKSVKVKKAEFVSGKGSFWGYTVTLDRIIRIRLILQNEFSHVVFDKLKGDAIRFAKNFGVAMESGYTNDMINKIDNAQSVKELIELILLLNSKKKFYQELKRF